MKILHTNFELLAKIQKQFKTTLTLEEERLLSIIISYRKEKDGCYYSNAQLSEWLKCSDRKAGNVKASLVKKGLITSTTRKGNSSILKPSNKVSIICQPVSITKQPRLAQDARNTSSKEEEDTNTITSSSFRKSEEWKEVYDKYVKGYGHDSATKYADTKIKQIKQSIYN
tara:strand:+ start:31 stop:540 length:510 start_codon:yes stop_codon:yes gene_type:complete